jgi:DNA polymerase-3 subunit delta'
MRTFVGNERAIAAVTRGLASGSPPHAWLFTGPERVGKATLACILAQALNCTGSSPDHPTDPVGAQHTANAEQSLEKASAAPGDGWREPCGECAQCRRIATGIHSDVQTVVIELDDDGRQRKGISVDQLREVERSVALKPYEGRTRVVIVDPADDMTPEAQNAFLKTLEEPPPNVVFVLVATREERLLPTVRSRCRRVEFRLMAADAIEAALRETDVEAEQSRLLARLAGGRVGWALEMAGNPALLEKRREVLAQARALAAMSLADRFDLAERLSGQFKNDRESVDKRLEDWLGWQRDVLLVQSGAEEGVANADMLDELQEDARRCDPREVLAFVQGLIACREHLASNVQSRIALDALMVEAPRAGVRAPA